MNIVKDIDFRKFIARQESQSIRSTTDFIAEAKDRLDNGVKVVGEPLPWQKTHDSFRFREGEITIWAGINGNGKSLVMGQSALWLAKKSKVLIASMEMLPASTVARMMRQASGVARPTESFYPRFDELTKQSIWIYDQVGSVTPEKIIGMIHWASEELGIKHIMIDSLVKCGINQSENEPQKRFVAMLSDAAKEHKIHIHLVVHIRKPDQGSANKLPTKFDIKGAGEITDLADNVLIISRNLAKEDMRMKGDSRYDASAPDGYITVAKQRHGEWEGRWTFWWHEQSQQWIQRRGSGPQPYPSANARL